MRRNRSSARPESRISVADASTPQWSSRISAIRIDFSRSDSGPALPALRGRPGLEDGTDAAADRIGAVGDHTGDIHPEVLADAFDIVREFPRPDEALDFRPSP